MRLCNILYIHAHTLLRYRSGDLTFGSDLFESQKSDLASCMASFLWQRKTEHKLKSREQISELAGRDRGRERQKLATSWVPAVDFPHPCHLALFKLRPGGCPFLACSLLPPSLLSSCGGEEMDDLSSWAWGVISPGKAHLCMEMWRCHASLNLWTAAAVVPFQIECGWYSGDLPEERRFSHDRRTQRSPTGIVPGWSVFKRML